MSHGTSQVKVENTAALGAKIVLVGEGSEERAARTRELVALHGYIPVPPADDRMIIAGQGTIGLEILEDLPDVDMVVAPVGGGGLISGIAIALKLSRPSVSFTILLLALLPIILPPIRQRHLRAYIPSPTASRRQSPISTVAGRSTHAQT